MKKSIFIILFVAFAGINFLQAQETTQPYRPKPDDWGSFCLVSYTHADTNYFKSQVNTSQNLNLSYGYLTWLNGKANNMLPQSQMVFPGSIIPNAPADLYAALGKNDQKIYVVPSQKLVIIRLGNTAGGVNPAGSDFDNELWGKLKTIIKY